MANRKMYPDLMTPREVATEFRVNPKTVWRWTTSGKLPAALKTPGGQYRYSRTTIMIMTTVQEQQ